MKVFIIPTSNVLTTAYYYSLIGRIVEKTGTEVIFCKDFKELHQKGANKKKDVVITGNPYPTFRLYLKGYKNLITWYQGVGPEERRMQGEPFYKIALHHFLESFSLRKSIFHFFVSNALKSHVERKYKVSIPREKYAIMPCFSETSTYASSFKEGVKKPYSFVYSGGMGVWQCFDDTLSVFKNIKAVIPEATLSVFTYQVDIAKEKCQNQGLLDVDVVFIKPDKLNKALEPFMFGFVLRKETVVNNVATPTKYSTYLANGVIPVFSSSVRDFTEVASELKYAIPIETENVESISKEVITKVQEIARCYDISAIKKEYDNLFASYYSEGGYIETISPFLKELFERL